MKRYVYSARSSKAYSKRGTSALDMRQQEEIRKGLESGDGVDPKFDAGQMEEIRKGLESGVDVNIYADPKFGQFQMEEIRKGLESGVDVNLYADPKFVSPEMREIRLGLEKYADDPLLDQTSIEDIVLAYKKKLPSLAYLGVKNKYQRAKMNWQSVKEAAASRQPLDIPALEEEFNLGTLEGRAAYTLGLDFEENSDGSITFTNNSGLEVATITSKEFDYLVRSAIANSSTRQSFAKAFATRLKRELELS